MAFILLLMTGATVPVNRHFRQTPDGIPIFVVSNGAHTDLVLPLHDPQTGHDWLRELSQPELTARFSRYRYVGFGWGNEGFFLGSMGGRTPGPGAMLRALLPSKTLVHASFYRAAPDSGALVVPLRVSAAQYGRLVAHVQATLAAPDSLGRQPLLQAGGYGAADFFFRARGRYHALRTCNDWTTRGLRRAGIRVPLKSPLAAPVLHHARQTSRKTR
ncbi:TIGR02117 family protein [Hymenobacter terrestris]|uniref:TIGR02117 family protein n=1 Tax=Hymenobacter terrestris TaxID=2748310 RepID=A0ABX2Q4L9_9BACT|nr:TIGR02117 family protein [Hymenobacter terrestris]NVO85911.1 TIGR02117 family protein [Hymenobacter terrestris]